MKNFPGILIFLALAVFSVSASGKSEEPQLSRDGTANPPPMDLLIPETVETATFALG